MARLAGMIYGRAILRTGTRLKARQVRRSATCGATGNCAAGGWANVRVTATLVRTEAFVVSEQHGRWGKATVVPGVTRLDTDGNSEITSVACASAGHCSAGGFYQPDHSATAHAFVVTER
jgi:hypothetical protein